MVDWPDDLLTQAQAAKLLKTSIISLWRLRPENNTRAVPSLDYVRHNGRIWYSKEDLAQYLRKCRNRRPHSKKRQSIQQTVQG